MKQVVQVAGGGDVRVVETPIPSIGATEVLVETAATIVSAGTERAVTALARSGLLAKARARPDLVRRVTEKARTDGIGEALRSVRDRLAAEMPLGYSGAGRAVRVGSAVDTIRPGDLVATGGAGWANHAEFQAVPGLLCARVPEGVPAADAAFATIAAIALHGLRLAEVGPGAKVVVVGLGLVGQLAARIALASGCDVAGVDLAELPLTTAAGTGVRALRESGDATTAAVREWSRGRGADAVLICTAGRSGDPVMRATEFARDRAQLVVVGDVPLGLARAPFYEKELALRFARSYGPGRYERGYEEWGVDYPAGQVRWTEGRNQEAVLDLLAAGRLSVADLVTHAFPLEQAATAYDLVSTRREPYLAIRFDYPRRAEPVEVASRAAGTAPTDESGPGEARPAGQRASRTARRFGAPGGRRGSRVGWIGAGNFSGSVLLPAFRDAGFDHFVRVASASGRSARAFADRHGFQGTATGVDQLLDDDDIDVVVIATPHSTHARLAAAALERGRHVWCEKPLALDLADLEMVEQAAAVGGGVLMVGLNRRFSPAVVEARRRLAERDGPLGLVYRVAAGPVPPDHWYGDRREGGRLLGEVCHFVDTCATLAGSRVEVATALPGRGGEALLAEDLAVTLRHLDGSLSTIAYSSARPRACRKEMIEALAGRRHLRIDDFRELVVDGDSGWKGAQDKGHRAAAGAFLRMCRGGATEVTAELIASSRATLAAAASLGTGLPHSVEPAATDPVDAVGIPAARTAGLGNAPPARPAAPTRTGDAVGGVVGGVARDRTATP
ncbi:Putative 1,5-anhydro-D-fructose reductase [Parafrankia sp. Ea1.12]|uniref:bi-domain-containing oxidoreductase n=1 Tax=Parafrankia sp. Ea1.12 TaxID=573499 RepID=UPI000DA4AEF2|nr:bi-domain-containing oxidoreductase [Parafrankia sp. Ea1.12]SQD97055.1 Putative 1,5-anhydro-D-fructose reductase [Parafrankia sp. Ea1.12]